MFSLKFHYYYNLVFFCTEKSIYDRIDWKTSANKNSRVKLYPMLLTFHGLPGSKKPTAFSKLAPHTNDENLPGFSHNELVVSGFGPGNEMRYTNTAFDDEFVQSLKSGVGLMNVWDIGMNTIIVPFLHQFSGHFSLNYTWLFIDLDRDLPSLHLPPVYPGMKWHSCVQHLLRSCHLYKYNDKKGVCKIFVTCMCDNNTELRLYRLKKECTTVAKQMGVEELVDIEFIRIMKSEEATKIVNSYLQSLFQQLKPQCVPLAWMSLRGSLDHYQSTCITHDELENEADKYRIKPDSLETFCTVLTSFGSILDVRLIDSQSKYIIIKPKEFLKELQSVLNVNESSELTYHGVFSNEEPSKVDRCELTKFLSILHSAGHAMRASKIEIFGDDTTTISGPAFYIPSVRIGKEKVRCMPGAIQLVIGIGSSPVNMLIKIADYLLCQFKNAQLILTQFINMATIRITAQECRFEIELTSMGDVIEILPFGNDKYGGMYKSVCRTIAKACRIVAHSMAIQSRDIKYHFAITCKKDQHREIGYNIYNHRHALPSDLCRECNVNCINKGQVTVWNDILKNVSKSVTFIYLLKLLCFSIC